MRRRSKWFFFEKKNQKTFASFRGRCAASCRLAATACLFVLIAAAARATPPFTATLIAGDDSLPVFANAVSAFRRELAQRHVVAPGAVVTLTASKAEPARRRATLDAIAATLRAMHPAPGQGCLVFATSHGEKEAGLYLAAGDTDLSPQALTEALDSGCGDAPTVIIISACFSGQFALPPMQRPNRIILTAARPDRTSFGCQAGRRYTVYDSCLLRAFPDAPTWRTLFASIRACVAAEEQREQADPSDPQAYFGNAVAEDLPAPHH